MELLDTDKISQSSVDDFLEEKNHFIKPKVENLDIRIFLDRLIGIFDILMTKLEYATTLPSVVSHPRVLEILSKGEFKQVVLAFDPLLYPQETFLETAFTRESWGDWTSSSETTINEDKASPCSPKSNATDFPKMNVDIYNAFEILSSYPLIRQVAKENRDQLSKSAQSFLRQLQYFMEFVISKTKLTPFEERKKELDLRFLISEIERTNSEISDLTVCLDNQKIRHSRESEEFMSEWNRYEEKWERINEEFNNENLKIIQESENDLAVSRETFANEMTELLASLEKAKESLAKQKANNRKVETDVQGKKFKVESQLQAILNKYDTEMGQRQEAYEELEKQYDDLENEKLQLMEEMEAQLSVYDAIIAEREQKQFAEFKEKYDKFVNNRSARVIQRWWRDILEKKKKQKKKKKKGKKKKK